MCAEHSCSLPGIPGVRRLAINYGCLWIASSDCTPVHTPDVPVCRPRFPRICCCCDTVTAQPLFGFPVL